MISFPNFKFNSPAPESKKVPLCDPKTSDWIDAAVSRAISRRCSMIEEFIKKNSIDPNKNRMIIINKYDSVLGTSEFISFVPLDCPEIVYDPWWLAARYPSFRLFDHVQGRPVIFQNFSLAMSAPSVVACIK